MQVSLPASLGLRGRKVKHGVALGLGVLLCASIMGMHRAHAALRVCNTTSFRVVAALGRYERPQGWMSEGWWAVDPGGCKVVISTPLHQRYYYLFAQGQGEHSKVTFSGKVSICIQMPRFKLYLAQYGKNTQAECAAAGLKAAAFFKVDTGGSKNHTVRLNHNGNTEVAAPAPQPAPSFRPAPPAPDHKPAPAATPSSACQRYPNLC